MAQMINSSKQNYQEESLASILFLTFNQERFVEDALLSLLNQDYENLEVVVFDDRSTDRTWEKIQNVLNGYTGSKKIIAEQNKKNLGIVGNYQAAFKKSTGEFIFTAAGDDISLPNRCSRSINFWFGSDKKYDLVATNAMDVSYEGDHLRIKETDPLENWNILRWFSRRPFFFGASHMVTRKLVNLASLNNQLPYEDQCLVFRALLMGGAARLPEVLVYHRRGGVSQSLNRKIIFGRGISQISKDMTEEILELNQFINDAMILDRYSEIEVAIHERMTNCQLVISLFQSPISIKVALEFWRNSSISRDLKYRYLRYYFFYPIYATGHYLRDVYRKLRDLIVQR